MQQQCFDLQIPWYDVQSSLAGQQQQLVGITNLQTVAQETQKYASQVERERERAGSESGSHFVDAVWPVCQLISCCRQVVRRLVNFVEEPIPSSSSSHQHLLWKLVIYIKRIMHDMHFVVRYNACPIPTLQVSPIFMSCIQCSSLHRKPGGASPFIPLT
jgi:hypothetical protein